MKKTLLATAIAGAVALSAATAQAATVYDQDGTKLDVNGRIAMGIRGGGPEYNANDELIDNGEEFVDVYSRLGLTMSHMVNSDVTAFGRVEWRFTGDERNTAQGFNEVRHSYIGLRSNAYGTVQAGNYDSFYNSFVASPFDVYLDRGLELTQNASVTGSNGGGEQARGDSIGYITPNLEGFTAFISAKHYSDRGDVEPSRGSVVATQGGATYEIDALRLALGYAEGTVRGGGTGENIYGTTASYEFMPGFSGRIGYEMRDDHTVRGGGYDTIGLGGTYAFDAWKFHADVYNIDPDNADSRTSWAAGAYYNVSSNFDVFLELQQADQQSINVTIDGLDSDVTADGDDMYWLTGARYHF
ncbi:porin [Halomonas urumqiensis]|uniref:Porin n=1 Tax=Halomonas urumqiensis TaxID=1684789 RepID=A0A2N7UCE2_9GAMM|nr:porin [Halomonas urumqiensis]PMR78113.1 porin [Halomonas urumqiensis]PTB03264.1 porin [Halomonas urumqiensis]GHE20577.1 porin [Halomonas urumqiensis]